ncbi:hypothetical protein BDV29DRAFT_12887 [Aspergillus leporis]|uniref:Uncharacterized protein n=1 Tax=Aspergillus leporis TaxID=41062 RepID=A0A5N5WU09_9EURO|nr:hypothetical protein BDV29DRAFT_12887 [Aspergillus leporis]
MRWVSCRWTKLLLVQTILMIGLPYRKTLLRRQLIPQKKRYPSIFGQMTMSGYSLNIFAVASLCVRSIQREALLILNPSF